MRKQLIVLGMLLQFALPVPAQVSFGFGFQTDNVSISLSSYPTLVRVPGYPVYYASGLNSNYFFYDGMYWIFETDRWYSSSWYNGPWALVAPEFIPAYLLRVPVRYYRRPPAFFMGWQANSAPRWGDHWGNDWARHRNGWDRGAMPSPAPLPNYQRKYSGKRYPSQDQQPILQQRNYRHQSRDPLIRQPSRPAPREQEQSTPHNNPQAQREASQRQKAEKKQQHVQPSNNQRTNPRSAQPEQRSGQQQERGNAGEQGQGRGR